MSDPDAYRRSGGTIQAVRRELRVELGGYGVIVFGADAVEDASG